MILANRILESVMVQGTLAALADARETLLIIEAILIGVLIVWQLIAMQAATASLDDSGADTVSKTYKKNIKRILITGICIVCVTAIITTVLGYFT